MFSSKVGRHAGSLVLAGAMLVLTNAFSVSAQGYKRSLSISCSNYYPNELADGFLAKGPTKARKRMPGNVRQAAWRIQEDIDRKSWDSHVAHVLSNTVVRVVVEDKNTAEIEFLPEKEKVSLKIEKAQYTGGAGERFKGLSGDRGSSRKNQKKYNKHAYSYRLASVEDANVTVLFGYSAAYPQLLEVKKRNTEQKKKFDSSIFMCVYNDPELRSIK